ncbi:ATP-binding protein [Paractinoplanes atraurantiacus]|uniref:ATPase family associated with various cellular activities (AAA) n=1 Tax=Paractinoplanes atraurantiacus TaxID=1036182 RepID=A0A285HQF8_9ACTN|nr:ATP-binding protein [Actinoplanes atraurantiacus]SNY37904.1 ATPase family associated with various cellular activities (AAA) [Actinoplanes atraurantiacus]
MTDLALEHLRLRMAELHHALRAAVRRQAEAAAALTRPDLTPFCVTDDQVATLLERVDAFTCAMTEPPPPPHPAPEPELALRRRAAAEGATLPLDMLARRFTLSRPEQDALLLVAAPALDAGYERVYAYIVDNLNRRLPSVELLVAVLAETPPARLALLKDLAPAGRLRRYGLLRPHGDAPVELTLSPGLFEFLLGWGGDMGLLGHDPGEVVGPAKEPGYPPPERLTRLGHALGAGAVDVVGVWGCPPDSQRDAALALAHAAGLPLRRGTADVEADLRTAAALNAMLWLETDDVPPVDAALLRSRVPVCLTGVSPWRPPALLAARAYAELTVPTPGFPERRAMWSAAFPALDHGLLEDLAVRYRMSGGELRAVAAVAGADARLSGNGHPIGRHVEPAIAIVTRGRTGGAVQSITPRRTMDDLVLPDAQLNQITEIVSAFRAWPRIAESWGFARRATSGGVKALFTGEPGTGKTLSAEVVTGMLGLELLKVDLAQVVSKWVGETEKNMEVVFQQAEDSHAVLLFDEADALFGKRGEVKQGTDRYANLEVGYLLQRLEASEGLIILTSNLKENIDHAFTRRFHFVVHFPRPGVAERRRLWQQAFPPEAPLAADVDVDALCRLDMTGAGITAAARTAALTAADRDSPTITMHHVVRGVSRQFQREARLFRPSELGRHAALLTDNGTTDA